MSEERVQGDPRGPGGPPYCHSGLLGVTRGVTFHLRSHSRPGAPIRRSSGAVEGSGLGLGLPSVPQPTEIWFVSMVTPPVCAKALPHEIVAPVSREMLSCARIFPANAVVLP